MSVDRDHLIEPDLAYSLTRAVDHVLRQAGGGGDLDLVHTAFGLGPLMCAAPDDQNICAWPGYARDAFLVDGGRLLGLTIRSMHPPEAARGLAGAAEFRQHFDASYGPLVTRALEHNQAVLAWRAFGGDHNSEWGVITGAGECELGFRGTIVTARGCETDVAVETPPWQVYVIERIEPRRRDDDEFAHAIVRHTRTALDSSLDETFGVVTGAAALGEWAGLIGEVPSDVSAYGSEHSGLALSIVTGLRALVATLDRIGTVSPAAEGQHVERIYTTARELIEELKPLTDAEAVSEAVMAPQDLVDMRNRVTTAKKTLEALAAAL